MPTIAPVCIASRQASRRSFSRNGSPTCTFGRLAGHGRAVDTVEPGLRADVTDRIAFTRRPGIEDLVFLDQPKRKCVDQRITGIARFELRLAAQVRYAKAIAV